MLEEATSQYQQSLDDPSACSADAREYLQGRLLDVRMRGRYRLGLVADPAPGHEAMVGRVSIPYLTPAGPVAIKFRCVAHADCKAVKCPKYLTDDDSGNHLYNARAVLAAKHTVAICEGEFDAMVVSGLAGVPAVGYPGADTWARNDHWPRVFAGLDVVVVADGDPPGIKAARAVAKSLDTARVVVCPPGDDSTSLIVREGPDDFRARLAIQ